MPYYIKNRGNAFGLFSEQQLVELKKKGKIGRNVEVSEDQTNWLSAENLPFLGFAPQQIVEGRIPAAQAATATANESPEWFYSADGKAGYGPVAASVIHQMLQEGTLTGNSFVWKQGAMAQAINTVPEFSDNPNPNPVQTPIAGTPSSGSTDILRPLSQSVSWLMFLKIVYLVGLVVIGLVLLYLHIWGLSVSIGTNRFLPVAFSLLLLTVDGGLYCLQILAFLSFWKYHSAVQIFTLMKDENVLIAANESLFKFWRWTAIWIIGTTGTILIALLIGFAIGGFSTGRLADLFGG